MKKIIYFLLFLLSGICFGQQEPDTSYNPLIANPTYSKGDGPVIFIDEGHQNFHTKDGNYWAFANLLRRDGYLIQGYQGTFTEAQLSKGKILVISNALNAQNVENWYLPNPSAFTAKEIETVQQWVRKGGNLFLIADHMPMAGAAADLAKAFGFESTNGFVFNTAGNQGTAYFKKENGTLGTSILTKGSKKHETINEIVSFTGQGFKIPDDATSVLTFDENYINVLPDTAWVFNNIPRKPAQGLSQGAYKTFGKGKVVMWGEAAMFTAQLAGPNKRKFGMSLGHCKRELSAIAQYHPLVRWKIRRIKKGDISCRLFYD